MNTLTFYSQILFRRFAASPLRRKAGKLKALISLSIFCLISYYSFGQCNYTPGVGCSLSITAPLTITGTPTWTGTVCIDADVTIADGGVLTISSGTNVSFEPGFSFTVEDGGALIIDDAELYASGGAGMWEGIIGEPGSYIYVDHSTIMHAEIAIETSGQGFFTSTLIVKNNTCIGNNEIGIYLHGEPSSLTHLIEDTEISAPALVSPKSGEVGDYGILIIGPTSAASGNFQIGNSLPFTSSTTFNHIHDVAIGIRTQTANVIVQNTFIENMLITDPADMPTGSPINELDLFHNGNIGILATSFDSPNLDNILIVGNSITGGGAINNYFYQNGDPGNNAIIAYNSMSTQILSNKIEGDNVSAYLMDTAIYIRKNTSSHDIRNNIINNFTECGILSYKVGNGTTLIQNNAISRVVNPGSSDLPFGIYVDAAASNQEVNIFDNTIEKVENGIFIRNHEVAYVRGNVINYDYGAGNTRGIYAVNCSDILIESNSATGPCNTGCPTGIIVTGYYIESCEGMLLKSNYSTNTRYGAIIDGNNQTGNMICNEMYNCLVGYAINDVEVVSGFSNDLGPIEKYIMMDYLPADNSWYPSSTANREKSYGSTDLTDLDWRFRNLYRDSSTPLPGFDMPTSLIDDPSLIPINEYSDYLDTCSSPYRLSGENDVEYFEAFKYKFKHFLNNPIAENNTGSGYLFRAYYWDLLQQYPQIIDSLKDEYLDMLHTIENTNIPLYYNLMHSNLSEQTDSISFILSEINADNEMEEALSYIIPFIILDLNDSMAIATDSDLEDILTLANSNPKQYGPAVYIAQAILGMRVEDPLEEELEEKSGIIPEVQFTMYPNPAFQYIAIQSNIEVNEKLKVEIYNMQGIQVYSSDYHINHSVDISKLNSGVYFVRLLEDNKNIFTENLLILN